MPIGDKIDFDKLVDAARSENTDDLTSLYQPFLSLESWCFIVSNNSSIEQPKPFIGLVDNTPWLFVFTDTNKARSYAEISGNFMTKGGSILVLKMEPKNAIALAKELYSRGVYGIRVNDGKHGWYCAIPTLLNIAKYLNIDISENA